MCDSVSGAFPHWGENLIVEEEIPTMAKIPVSEENMIIHNENNTDVFKMISIVGKRLKAVMVLLIILFLQQTVIANAQAPEFMINDVPVLVDAENNILYVSLLPDTEKSFKAIVTTKDSLTMQFALDNGSWHNAPHKFNIENWQDGNYTMRLKSGKKETVYTLVFSTLPFVNIDVSMTALRNAHDEDASMKIPAELRVIDPLARTAGTTDYRHHIATRIRGQHSSEFKKKPFGIELRDSAEETVDEHMFGLRNDDDWVLDAMWVDPARMRNRTMTDLWNSVSDLPYEKDNEYQANGSSGLFVEVFVKNKYYGLYCFTDKIDRKKLNLKKSQAGDDDTIIPRGLLYRGRKYNEATVLRSYDENASEDTLRWCDWLQEYPDDNNAVATWQPLKDFIDVVSDDSKVYHQLSEEYMEWLYPENLADYFLFVNAFYLKENTMKNYFLSFVNIKKQHRALFTLWDMDASFGRKGDSTPFFDDSTRYAFDETLKKRIGLTNRLMEDNTFHFKSILHDRWESVKNNQLSVSNVEKTLRTYAKLLTKSGAFAREQAKWGESAAPDIDAEIDQMVNWYARQWDMVEKKLKKYPRIYTLGDANNDGDVDVTDIAMIAAYILDGTIDGLTKTAADSNLDGIINVMDISTVAASILDE